MQQRQRNELTGYIKKKYKWFLIEGLIFENSQKRSTQNRAIFLTPNISIKYMN